MWQTICLLFVVVSAALVTWTAMGSCNLLPESEKGNYRRWLLGWSARGLVIPILLWGLMNVGLSFSLQPFMPDVQAAKNAGRGWLPVFLVVLSAGVFVASSYWSAVTFGWRLVRAGMLLDSAGRKSFRNWLLGWCAWLALPALGLVWLGGWGALGLAVFGMVAVAAHHSDRVLNLRRVPMYARAVARIKFGKYAEAEWEIIRELEKCEDDFDGWMMMAELYATQFHDLEEAQKQVAELCEQPKTTIPQFAIALNRLADWHLKLGKDPEGARRALQVICDRLPGTHLARMAELRIRQLPRSQEEMEELSAVAPIPLPALGDALDDQPPVEHSRHALERAAETARGYVQRLEADPNDSAVREKLARLMAERLNQPQNAIEQLQLLLEVADQPEAKYAEWLSLIAAWQIKHLEDPEQARSTLEKLIRQYPKSPQSIAARRRIQLMDRELKSQG